MAKRAAHMQVMLEAKKAKKEKKEKIAAGRVAALAKGRAERAENLKGRD